MDSMTRALLALEEIPRTEPGWRGYSNRPPSYTPPRGVAPPRLW